MGGGGASLSKAARMKISDCSKSPWEFDFASVVARTKAERAGPLQGWRTISCVPIRFLKLYGSTEREEDDEERVTEFFGMWIGVDTTRRDGSATSWTMTVGVGRLLLRVVMSKEQQGETNFLANGQPLRSRSICYQLR
jgi:hypothetical protein